MIVKYFGGVKTFSDKHLRAADVRSDIQMDCGVLEEVTVKRKRRESHSEGELSFRRMGGRVKACGTKLMVQKQHFSHLF